MPMPITAASAATHIPKSAAPPPEAAAPANTATGTEAAQPPAGSAAASRWQQQAALNRLLVNYTYDQSRGADARILSALGKQIAAAARALGQHVTLPRAPASSGAGSATQAASGAPETGKVNVTA